MDETTPADPATPQIAISPSPAGDQTAAAARDLGLVIAALPAIVALLGKHTVTDAVDFISSSGFAPIGTLLVIAIVWIRQRITRRNHANDVRMAASADNDVAIVTPAGGHWLSRMLAKLGL